MTPPVRLVLAFLLPLALVACSGTNSTLREGFAYRMSREDAKAVVHGAIAANVSPDRINPAGELVASGYDRSMLDTQTFNASAVHIPAKDAYGFEVSHYGTMLNGPARASQIYRSLLQRADATGQRISVRK